MPWLGSSSSSWLIPVARLGVVALLLFFAGTSAGRFWSAAARRRTLRRRAHRAITGEAVAESLLESVGFEVEQRQAWTQYELWVNGQATRVNLRADYLVRRHGRRFVAEVKTGRYAPNLGTAATRRQLLEYRMAFDVDGVLLVDADAGTMSTVEFPSPQRTNGDARRTLVFAIVWLVVGGLVVAFLGHVARG